MSIFLPYILLLLATFRNIRLRVKISRLAEES